MTAAALDHVDTCSAAPGVFQVQAQRGWRGFAKCSRRAVQESQLRIFPGGQLQTPQAREGNALRPGQDDTATTAAQGLLTGPEGLLFITGSHQQQPFQ